MISDQRGHPGAPDREIFDFFENLKILKHILVDFEKLKPKIENRERTSFSTIYEVSKTVGTGF